jgi:uncharacterized HAD superfamily protein
MQVYIDIDNVIADCVGATLEHTNRRYGLSMTHEDVTDYDIAGCVAKQTIDHTFQGKPLAPRNVIDSYIHGLWDGGLFRDCKMVKGAGKALHEWFVAGVSYQYITCRPEIVKADTVNWIERNTSAYHAEDWVTFCTDKCDHLKPGDILIDDHSDTCIKAAKAGVRVAMLAWPWNATCEEHENIVRCADWTAIVEAVRGWEQ